MFIGSPPLKLSAYTSQDSDGNNMINAHAYKARGPGFVFVYNTVGGGRKHVRGYVGLTDDPAGAGRLIQHASQDTEGQGCELAFSMAVSKNEYFEITNTDGNPIINWKSFGVLLKPVDFN